MPTYEKVAEAKKMIEKSRILIAQNPDKGMLMDFSELKELLAAQDLISYERGREDQKKIDVEIISMDGGVCTCCVERLERQILNNLSQQALKSDNQNADAK